MIAKRCIRLPQAVSRGKQTGPARSGRSRLSPIRQHCGHRSRSCPGFRKGSREANRNLEFRIQPRGNRMARSGPDEWTKQMSCFSTIDCDVLDDRASTARSAPGDRRIIKYIGSPPNSCRERPNKDHRNKRELVDVHFRKDQQSAISGDRVILQNAHYHDLVSWPGLAKLPKTSRGQGWHIVNRGEKGPLSRVIAYPAFAVSGRDG
jgi:hypothetical protein